MLSLSSRGSFSLVITETLSSRDINSTIISPAVSYSKRLFCFCKDSLSLCCQTFGQNEARSFELLLRSENFLAFSVTDKFNYNRSWTLSLNRRVTRSTCFQPMTPLGIIIRRNFHAQLLRDDIKYDFVYIFSFMRVFLTPLRTRHFRLEYCSNSSTCVRSCWMTSYLSSKDSLMMSMSPFRWSFGNSMSSNLELMNS